MPGSLGAYPCLLVSIIALVIKSTKGPDKCQYFVSEFGKYSQHLHNSYRGSVGLKFRVVLRLINRLFYACAMLLLAFIGATLVR